MATKPTTQPPSPARLKHLRPGQRVLVHLTSGEEVPGRVYHNDNTKVDLDRRAKDASVHLYKDSDGNGRANRIAADPAMCSALDDKPVAPLKVCPHCGEAL